eukprot:TRINITY_DN1099_c0_g1_i1.p1 TRINITY_DN1099_c0_g1~~TRINITY_DN1099_c0_g1_i1.p1  ORF type:complete len:302 (+),score=64.65 TRINITY_DN1099_c0_g1_i1:1597-2502(+)
MRLCSGVCCCLITLLPTSQVEAYLRLQVGSAAVFVACTSMAQVCLCSAAISLPASSGCSSLLLKVEGAIYSCSDVCYHLIALLPTAQVEAYLRLTGIPFTVVYGTVAGPFGKVPFIELNGEQHADSSHIIDVLATKFGHNLDEGLSAQQKAVGHAFQRMAEESLYFYVIYARWEDDAGWDSTFKAYIGHAGFVVRSLCNYILRPKFRKICAAQGTGRFPPSVVVERFGKDMQALSDFLGDNNFLLGTAAPTTVDIAVFGQLDSLFNAGVTTLLDEKVAEFPTLAAYVQRIAKLVFPPASAA